MDNIQDAYVTPKSNVSVPNTKPGSPVKGVIYGVLIDIGGTILFSTILGIVWATLLLSQGVSKEQAQIIMQNPNSTSPVMLFGMVVGCMISVFACYICGRVAKKYEYRLSILIFVMLTLFFMVMGKNNSTLISFAVTILANISSALFGAYLAVLRNTR